MALLDSVEIPVLFQGVCIILLPRMQREFGEKNYKAISACK
jgi:hypothetical protein